MLNNSRGLIIAAAVVAVGGLAVAGFMHRNGSSTVSSTPPMVLSQPVDAVPNAPVVSQAVYPSDGYYSSSQRPVYVRQQYSQPATGTYTENTESRDYTDGPQYSAGPRREHEVYRENTVYHHGRSKAHSVEIVAGTAGVGAAIGAIAGGGKGAAIGAVSGGAAGFAYDRLTHNH